MSRPVDHFVQEFLIGPGMFDVAPTSRGANLADFFFGLSGRPSFFFCMISKFHPLIISIFLS